MATPSGKNNPTPTQFTSSPFQAGAAPMGRPLSHKSPPMRTPSASGGQTHLNNHPSTSSQQYPTPLAAAASTEDAATFSSPSALLALGLGGNTPFLGDANEGLVGRGMSENDISGMGIPTLNMGGGQPSRDNDAEKRKRLDEVLRILRTRVVGRGVSREGVERLGKLEGLECLWQEDNLSIAGNFVDLEIEFLPGKECVRDVVLRYASPDAEEGEKREEASAVLKRNLAQSVEDQERGSWKDMTDFHDNLKQLARMDHLSQQVNCFQAIEGLYDSLKRIWEDQPQGTSQAFWEHVCTGSVGRPCMHLGKNLGLSLQYWVEQRRTLDSKKPREDKSDDDDRMDIDRPARDDPAGNYDNNATSWAVVIECEEGYPSLRMSKEWVSSPVHTIMKNEEDSAKNTNRDDIKLVNWVEPPPTLVPTMNNNADGLGVDPSMMGNSASPNRRFVARLEPQIDLPIAAASEIYRALGMDMPQEFKLNTYDGLLLPIAANTSASGQHEHTEQTEKPTSENSRKRQRELYTFDDGGQPTKRCHEYKFHTFEQVAGRTLRDLPFSHPRQLADVIPILRQYALISSILRRIFPKVEADSETKTEGKGHEPHRTKMPESKTIPLFLSNADPTASKLDAILSNGDGDGESSSPERMQATKIDVSLRTPMSSAPSILLLFNVPDNPQTHNTQETSSARAGTALRTVTLRININLDGRIAVAEVTGVWDDEDSAEQGNTSRAAEAESLCQKLSKVLEACEDLGMLVEWLLRWSRRRSKQCPA